MMINRKNYVPIVCILFTILTFGKLLVEQVLNMPDPYYTINIISVFIFSAVIVAVLGAGKYFSQFPLWLVIAGQYVVMIGVAMLITWIDGQSGELAASAYHDMFWSFTIPFVVIAVLYYLKCFMDVRKTNQDLERLQEMVEKGVYPGK